MTNDLSRNAKIQLIALLEEKKRRATVYRYRKFYDALYWWQKKFIANTAAYSQTCLMAANRVGKCISDNTLIDTPSGRVALRDLMGSGFDVLSMKKGHIITARAEKPFSKGMHQCFEIGTDAGSFIAADFHRMEVSGYWIFPAELYCFYERPLEYVRGLLSSSLECDLLAHVSDVQHSMQTIEDSLLNYSKDCYRYDERLHFSEEVVRDAFPSQADALKRILAWYALGVLANKDTHILSQFVGHLSNLDDQSQNAALFFEWLYQAGSKIVGRTYDLSQVVSLLNAVEVSHPQSIGELQLQVAHDMLLGNVPFSNSCYESNSIVSCIDVGSHEVFDFSVPETGNYLACGVIHHNTWTGTYVDAIHAMGDYPDDWTGHRFSEPPMIWVLGYSGDKLRDLLQNPIFGTLNDGTFSGGLIPVELIVDVIPSGVPRLAKEVQVKHKSGGVSRVQFWSYSQGQHALMGDDVDWFHVDEEPKDQTIYPQVLIRTGTGDNGRGGRGILTFTPENGRTDLVIQFSDNPSPGQTIMTVGWDDAPHLDEKVKSDLLASFPAHQRDMRSKGIPMLGHGRIFDLAEEFITCDSFDLPPHWFVVDGQDFGWDHPQAHIQLAIDRDNDAIYVVRAWKASKTMPIVAWGAVKPWAEKVPVAWPADGLQTEKGSAKQQKSYYVEAGFNMLPTHATWPDGSNGVEAGLMEIRDMMLQGKFKVFKGLREVFEEFLQYHRDDRGNIVKVKDDLWDAIRYAYMMRRFAIRRADVGKGPVVFTPLPTVSHFNRK